MNVLVVGAGAVGQVMGHFLYRGGAEVSYFVKPRHRESLAQGIRLHPLRRASLGREEHWDQFQVVSQLDDCLASRWDQIWLCIPSNGLNDSALQTLLKNGQYGAVVNLLPGLEDRLQLQEYVDPTRLVQGLIGFLSYQTPLPGQQQPSEGGVAYLVPPGIANYFDGPEDLAATAVQALSAGGMPAAIKQDLHWVSMNRSAMAIPLMAGLELGRWDLHRLRNSRVLDLATDAGRQAMRVTAAYFGRRPRLQRFLLKRRLLGPTLDWAGRWVTFDLERYLQFHFSKVGEQTERMLTEYIQQGERLDIPVNSLRHLLSDLQQTRRETGNLS